MSQRRLSLGERKRIADYAIQTLKQAIDDESVSDIFEAYSIIDEHIEQMECEEDFWDGLENTLNDWETLVFLSVNLSQDY